jgi:hypothetical protein
MRRKHEADREGPYRVVAERATHPDRGQASRLDPRATAQWRYDQIVETLGKLAHDVRGEIVARISATPARWPGGTTRLISRATLYRWIWSYERGRFLPPG